MDFSIPDHVAADLEKYQVFLQQYLQPHLADWYKEGAIDRDFFRQSGRAGYLGYERTADGFVEQSALKQAVLYEHLAKLSPGVAVALLVHISLGIIGPYLFGDERQRATLLEPAVQGETLICLGNTEPTTGSDVAGLATTAQQVDGGWLLNGTKAFSTNAAISDWAIITAVTDPQAPRNRRISMFLVDLSSQGIARRKLHKAVWVPSDLTRIQFSDVLIPPENLLGERGKGLQQVLKIFTHSRITISALTLGTAAGAFELALEHARRRRIFGKRILDYQAKAFEMADFYSKIEAARLMLHKACWTKDQGLDFRFEASLAKYLAVEVARAVSGWAADLFGAASVVVEHPIHKYPMDAWAASLGEGTQDVQKLVIFRELMKRAGVETKI